MLLEKHSAVVASLDSIADAIASDQQAVRSGSNRSAASIATQFLRVPLAMRKQPSSLPCRETRTHATRTCSARVTARPN